MSTERNTFQKVKLITGIVLLVLVIIIIIQNLASVTVDILFWEVDISLFILTSLNLVIGFLLGCLFVKR
ncbi:MAG: LapA family protein [Crocinitomicaceae bacterium]